VSNKVTFDYWYMLFYFCMAVITAGFGLYYWDLSWLLLALGSSSLGISSRMTYLASQSKDDDEKSANKSGLFSRVGFLLLASGLLVNALNGGF
jgi:cyanate permease